MAAASKSFASQSSPTSNKPLSYPVTATAQTSFRNCECVGVPSGAFARLVSVLFVRDSIPE